LHRETATLIVRTQRPLFSLDTITSDSWRFGGRMDGTTLAGRWQGHPVGTSRGAPLLPECLAVPGAAQPRSHRARDRQRDGRTWIAPGHREQRADCWPGLGPILSTLGTLPALTRPRATFLGWSSKSAAVAALASGIRIQGRELKKVPEPSGIRSRQPGNAWYDEILSRKAFGPPHLSSLPAVVARVDRVPDLRRR